MTDNKITALSFLASRDRYLTPHQPPRRLSSGRSGMGLLEAIFSFVFGDADPNENFDAERWEKVIIFVERQNSEWDVLVGVHGCERLRMLPFTVQIGQYIQSRGGVVAAEELSPFLEGQCPSSDPLSSTVDEAFVLPVLNRFGGSPVVSESGDILYHFPELQKTATASQVQRRFCLIWEKRVHCVGISLWNVSG